MTIDDIIVILINRRFLIEWNKHEMNVEKRNVLTKCEKSKGWCSDVWLIRKCLPLFIGGRTQNEYIEAVQRYSCSFQRTKIWWSMISLSSSLFHRISQSVEDRRTNTCPSFHLNIFFEYLLLLGTFLTTIESSLNNHDVVEQICNIKQF